MGKNQNHLRVGILKVYFMILSAQSLKEKRMVVRSLKDRLMSTFNVSVAEIGENDKWQVGELGLATVGNDSKYVLSALEEVKRFIGGNPSIRVLDSHIEVL